MSNNIDLLYMQINESFLRTTLKYFCYLPEKIPNKKGFIKTITKDGLLKEVKMMDGLKILTSDIDSDKYCPMHPVVFSGLIDTLVHRLFGQMYERYDFEKGDEDFEKGDEDLTSCNYFHSWMDDEYKEEVDEELYLLGSHPDFRKTEVMRSSVVLFFICLFPWTKDNVKEYKIFNNFDIESLYEPVLKDGLGEDYSYRIKMNYLMHFTKICAENITDKNIDPIYLVLDVLSYYGEHKYPFYLKDCQKDNLNKIIRSMICDIFNAIVLVQSKDLFYYKYTRISDVFIRILSFNAKLQDKCRKKFKIL